MKTRFLKGLPLGCLAALLTMACNNANTTESQAATQNPDSMRQDKTQVYVDTLGEMTFRQHEDSLIKANREEIAHLKGMARSGKRTAVDKYNEQLDTLTQENSRMETRLHKLGRHTKSDWEVFKHDFNRDMDSIGKSISRVTEKI